MIEALDLETGEVWIQRGGEGSGCGISPTGIRAIQQRLVKEFEAIEAIHADAGIATPGDGRNTLPNAPFEVRSDPRDEGRRTPEGVDPSPW